MNQPTALQSSEPAVDRAAAAPVADRPPIGAIEAGGTKMVLACGYADGTITERTSIPTQDPAQTVSAMIEWFANKGIAALGIAAFGPTGVNPSLSTYGHILQTPKLAWRNFDFLGAMSRGLGVPCGYDTDVNGACLGEVMAARRQGAGFGHAHHRGHGHWRRHLRGRPADSWHAAPGGRPHHLAARGWRPGL